MKTIVWKSEDITKRNSAPTWRVSAVVISARKPPRAVGSITGSYVSEAQLLMMLLEREKILPRAAFTSGRYGGPEYMPHTLEAAGFARCYHL